MRGADERQNGLARALRRVRRVAGGRRVKGPEPERSPLERLARRLGASEGPTRWWPLISIGLGPAIGLIAFITAQPAQSTGLSPDGVVMVAIFALAAWYWVTGAVPAFATGILIIGLCAFFLGLPAQVGRPFGLDASGSTVGGWRDFVEPASASVIILMLGGFALGAAAHRHGLDAWMAGGLLRVCRRGPRTLLLGSLAVTAVLSMWMSNTATAAMMTTLILPVARRYPEGSAMRRGLLLSVPLGANIGGIGTPIGTPPNAIAFSLMRGAGLEIGFIGWMAFAVPLLVLMMVAAWAYLAYFNGAIGSEPPPQADDAGGPARAAPTEGRRPRFAWSPKRLIVAGTFLATVGLWVTGRWTGVDMALAAMVPIVAFTAFGVLDRRDVNGLDWDILLLITGGLALGTGMQQTGLAEWLVARLPTEGIADLALASVFAAFTLVLATFMSNTAAANLILPLAIGVGGAAAVSAGGGGAAAGDGLGLTGGLAVAVALAASIGMALPVSTPPNAIAFATGEVKTVAFLRSALVLDTIGIGGILVICLVLL